MTSFENLFHYERITNTLNTRTNNSNIILSKTILQVQVHEETKNEEDNDSEYDDDYDSTQFDAYFIMEGVKYAGSFSSLRWKKYPKPKLSRTTKNDNFIKSL